MGFSADLEIKRLDKTPEDWGGDALLVMAYEKGEPLPSLKAPYDAYMKTLVERGDFKGKKGSIVKVPLFGGKIGNLYAAGLGKPEDCSPSAIRDVLTAVFRKMGRERNRSVLLIGDFSEEEKSVVLGEAAELCSYAFDKYLKKEEESEDFSLREIVVPEFDARAVKRGQIYASAQKLARDLANEPGNVINPVTLADYASSFARENDLECEVWDEQKLERERMGALIAVGQGSLVPPRLIHLTYRPKGQARKKIVFVGKGITFDSGGLDLKPAEFMKTMKGDKSGACNVLGIMKGVADLAPDVEVHGILAAAENMPSGKSFRPDDIIRARNGKTIEIDNTDAEGRLVLADALTVASELKPDAIIDMATLTGACAVALGNWTAGIFTQNDSLCEALTASSSRRGERLWRLPMDDEKIAETLKSKFADLVNGASRYGGATFAAMFLAEFVDKEIAWAHLDIAGVDFYKDEWGVYSRGASAWGVRTCLDYLCV